MAKEKYKKLIERLRGRILGGEFVEGNPFPSEGVVARKEGLSRFTVHKAFLELRRMGLITGGIGKTPHVFKNGASRKMGLLISGIGYSEFFQPVVRELLQVAEKNGYIVILGDISSLPRSEMIPAALRFARRLVAERVAGVIYQPFEFFNDSATRNRRVLRIFDDAGIPVVLLGYDIVQPPECGNYDVIGINNCDAGARLTRHLLSVGARRIHFAMTPSARYEPSCINRVQGVIAALGSMSFDVYTRRNVLVDSFCTPEALRRHLKKNKVDAFICCNDAVAASLMQMLTELNLRVPDDLLVAGFDNVNIARLVTPTLTTIDQPCDRIAQVAFRQLSLRIAEPRAVPMEMFLPAPLVVRASTTRTMRTKKPVCAG